MSAKIYFLYSLVVCVVYVQYAKSQISSNQYITQKLEETKEKMVRSYFETALKEDPHIIHEAMWNMIWSKQIEIEPRTISIFGRTFIFMNNRIYSMSPNTSTMLGISEINQEIPINFIKSFAWKKELFLLICQPVEYCNLFTANSNIQLTSRQIFRYIGSPMDACFFSKKNQLHLIVLSSNGKHETSSVVYRWTGKHMEIVTTIPTTGAVAITTFRSKRSVILVFAQNVEEQASVGSVVYEFKDNKIQLLQFLHTEGPTAIQHFRNIDEDFVLIQYQAKLSEILWWDGKTLIKWLSLPDTLSLRIVKTVSIEGELYFILCKSNSLHVYKFGNNERPVVNSAVTLQDTIIDFDLWFHNTSINIIVITIDKNNTYHIESWNLRIAKKYFEISSDFEDLTMRCMMDLEQLLKQRMSQIESLKTNSAEKFNFSLTKNTESTPLNLPNLFIDNANITSLYLSSNNEQQIPVPEEMLSFYQRLETKVDNLYTESVNTVKVNKTNFLTGNVTIEGDAIFQELTIDSLQIETLNGQKVDFENVLWSTKDQNFSNNLKGRIIIIHNLEIPMICGLSSEYWLLENDSEKTGLTELAVNDFQVGNDTIVINSDLSLNTLGIKKINDVVMKDFFNDVFISGSQQTINGSITYKGWLQVVHLNVDVLNDVYSHNLLSTTTSQKLDASFFSSLQVKQLFVERINGIHINNTARSSTENVIKGKVTLANLIITDELFVDNNLTSHLPTPIQIYEDVKIIGDIFLKDLKLEPYASMNLNNVNTKIQSLLDNSWSKSSHQTISSPVILVGGITIDELMCQRLNGNTPDDFLYTDVKEITSDFKSIVFSNFHFKGLVDERGNKGLHIEETPSAIIVRQKLRIKSLEVDNIFLDKFNRIPVNAMSGGNSLRMFGTSSFETIKVLESAEVEELEADYVNDKNASIFHDALKVDDDIKINYLKTNAINVRNMHLHVVNGKFLSYLANISNWAISPDNINIIIDGDLEVAGNVNVDVINGESAKEYLQSPNLNQFSDQVETIDELRVTKNLIAHSINGIKIEHIFQNAFSRSKPQKITGEFTFLHLNAKYLSSKHINGKDSTSLIFVNEPLSIFGNVTFSSLSIYGDISGVKSVNGYNVNELSEKLHVIPNKLIGTLTVTDNVTWKVSSNELNSVSYLFNNSVLKNVHQVIDQPITFKENAYIDCLINKLSDVIDNVNIPKIISDSVINEQTTNPVTISGIKTFKNKISIEDFKVTGDIGIEMVNDLNIVDLNASIVRRNQDETIFGETTFLKSVKIKNLLTNGGINDIPALKHTFSRHNIPKVVHFEHLIVKNNVTLHNLDGVNFDDFVKTRVTLTNDHEVFGNVQFTEPVRVLDNTFTMLVNGINPQNLVISGLDQMPQVINGTKIFSKDILISGDVDVDVLNELDVKKELGNGVSNHENVDVFGNIIFKDLEVTGVVNITGHVNGFYPKSLLKVISTSYKSTLDALKFANDTIEHMATSSASYVQTNPVKFEYLEPEKYLKIHVPGVQKCLASYDGLITRLDLYGEQLGRFCNLPDDCLCRLQTVVEIAPSMDWKMWRENNTVFAFNFRDQFVRHALTLISESTSSSKRCSTPYKEWKTAKMLWEKTTQGVGKKIIFKDLNTAGFVSDVKTFLHNGRIILILAISHDSSSQSRLADSLIYELNLETGEMILAQSLATMSAKSLNVFEIPKRGPHLLVGCAEESESFLYRMNAVTNKFELLRRFSSTRSNYVASLIRADDVFVLLANPVTQSLQIFAYNMVFDNFYDYQNIRFDSSITGLEAYYTDYALGESYIIVTTKSGWFYIYEYMLAGKFQLRMKYWMAGLQTLASFNFMNRQYLFAGARTNSTIMRVIRQGAA